MNKKGAELPMNTLIAAIIAIVVLLLIITFFTGGLGTIGEKIRDIFGKGTAGYDVSVAKNFCNDYCSAAQGLMKEGKPDLDARKNSAYCNEKFDIKLPDGSLNVQDCNKLIGPCSGVSCT